MMDWIKGPPPMLIIGVNLRLTNGYVTHHRWNRYKYEEDVLRIIDEGKSEFEEKWDEWLEDET